MELLEYNIENKIRAFSTMRGEGSGNYGGFNVTHYCGDTTEHVAECRKILCKELAIEEDMLIIPRQTHSDKSLFIDSEFMQLPQEDQTQMLYGIDAIFTNIRKVCIGVSTADCIPILLHDKANDTIAAIHAGWRGTVAEITSKCIDAMRLYLGCEPDNIHAIIGPGISLDAFEVGDEVYEEFSAAGYDMKRIAKQYQVADGGKKWHIDLWEANRQQLISCGIKENNIETAGICTFSNSSSFFSARRLGIKSGRIFSGIMMK